MLDLKKYFFMLALASACHYVLGSNEISNILNDATDLTSSEMDALKPLFEDLQRQYDLILGNVIPGELVADESEKQLLREEIFMSLESITNGISLETGEQPLVNYETQLPELSDLLKLTDKPFHQGMTQEQIYELEDIEALMADTLSEAQNKIDVLVKRAHGIESEFLKLNKPKILTYIYKALSILYSASSTLRRSAYCVYSNVPQLNESLHSIYDGVDCYTYTTALIVRVQTETVQTVRTITGNVLDLANVYKKIANKNSLLGKILTGILSITRIINDIRESYSAAMKALDAVENQLPGAVSHSVDCGTDFATKVPFVVESIGNVTECLLYVEGPSSDYDFLLPESERQSRDFNDIE